MTGEVFADFRKAEIDHRLRATLAFLEKVTLSPTEVVSDDLVPLREAGLTDRAILDATYVCAGFSIIARIADALGFEVPSEELFARAARLLVIFGYKRLSGFWTGGFSKRRDDQPASSSVPDPYDGMLSRLRNSVLVGPGTLTPSIRQSICEGREMTGLLGAYVKKVAEYAYQVTDEDITELHLANYSDDQIFEATVSAALGAGILRVEGVLGALRSEQALKISPAYSPFDEATAPSITNDVAVV